MLLLLGCIAEAPKVLVKTPGVGLDSTPTDSESAVLGGAGLSVKVLQCILEGSQN